MSDGTGKYPVGSKWAAKLFGPIPWGKASWVRETVARTTSTLVIMESGRRYSISKGTLWSKDSDGELFPMSHPDFRAYQVRRSVEGIWASCVTMAWTKIQKPKDSVELSIAAIDEAIESLGEARRRLQRLEGVQAFLSEHG